MNQAEIQVRDVPKEQSELATALAEWTGALAQRFRGGLRLAMAETRLAVSTFVLMIFLVVLSAGALTIAWALMAAALVQTLAIAGLKLIIAIAVVCAAHLLIAWLLWRLANGLGRHLEFSGTRRMLGS